jgi:hypothetical protein
LRKEHRSGACFLQVAVHPDERPARCAFSRWRESPARQAPMKVPSDKQPPALGVEMRKPPLRMHKTSSGFRLSEFSVAHAGLRLRKKASRRVSTRLARVRAPRRYLWRKLQLAASAIVPTPGSPFFSSLRTACATSHE